MERERLRVKEIDIRRIEEKIDMERGEMKIHVLIEREAI